MNLHKKPLLAGLLSVGLLSLSGCATHVKNLPSELNPNVQKGSVTLPAGSIISIQYPMLASTAAKQQLIESYPCKYNNFINHPLGSCGNPAFTGQFAPMLFEQSTYYAAELKKVLGRYIDERSVRLEPLFVDYRDGRFETRPALSNISPSVLVIELYDFPAGVKHLVGSGYRAEINIRSAGKISPQTCGNLLVIGGHHKFDKSKAEDCTNRDARSTPSFMPLQYFAEEQAPQIDFPKQGSKPIGPGAVLTSKTLWEENQNDYLTRSSRSDFKVSTDNIQNTTSDWIARTAIIALGKIDTPAAFDAGFAIYLQSYDPALAERFRTQALQASDSRKIAVVRKLLSAENDWLASQNTVIGDGILNGNYGQSFRKSRLLLAKGFNKSQTLGWLQVGATLASGFSSGLLGGGTAYDPTMLMTQTLQNEQQFAAASSQIEQALIENLAPSVQMRDQVVQVSIEGVNAKISGTNQSEIHTQLKALYKKLAGT